MPPSVPTVRGPVRVLVVEVVPTGAVLVRRRLRAGLRPAVGEFPSEGVVVGVGTEVLQLPGNLGLLGLLTAAPHGVDPLTRRPGAGAHGGAPEWSSVSRDAKRYNVLRCSGIPPRMGGRLCSTTQRDEMGSQGR